MSDSEHAELLVKVDDLPPVPEGHRRVITVHSRMSRTAWQAFCVATTARGLGPATFLLMEPGESVEFGTERSPRDVKSYSVPELHDIAEKSRDFVARIMAREEIDKWRAEVEMPVVMPQPLDDWDLLPDAVPTGGVIRR